MPMPLRLMARCARPGAVRSRVRARAATADRSARAAGPSAADAAVVADSKRNFVYGLHAVNAALERAPERVLELWVAQLRDDARARELKERAGQAGVHVHAASAEALSKLVGDVVHQGAV